MNLERELQLQILEHLRSLYPRHSVKIDEEPFANHPHFFGNLVYLSEHKLLEFEPGRSHPNAVLRARITHVGLDFLQQDGGIHRILKTVPIEVVNAHDFLAILEKKVAEAPISESEKKSLLEKLKTFSTPVLQSLLAQTLKSLVEQLLQLPRSL